MAGIRLGQYHAVRVLHGFLEIGNRMDMMMPFLERRAVERARRVFGDSTVPIHIRMETLPSDVRELKRYWEHLFFLKGDPIDGRHEELEPGDSLLCSELVVVFFDPALEPVSELMKRALVGLRWDELAANVKTLDRLG